MTERSPGDDKGHMPGGGSEMKVGPVLPHLVSSTQGLNSSAAYQCH